MKALLKRSRNSPLVKNLVSLAGGNSIAQVVVILISPLITRIYSPETFGIQGVFLAAVGLLAPLVCLRYPMAIVLAKTEDEISKLGRISLGIAFGFSAFIFLLIVGFGDAAARLLGLDGVGALIYMLPVALLFVGLQEISNYKAARRRRFRAMSVVTAVQAFVINGAKVVGGLIAPLAATLVVLSSVGPGIHAVMLSASRSRTAKERPAKGQDSPTLKSLAKSHRDFALMKAPSDLASAASHTVPVMLLGAFFSPGVAGLYALTRSVMNVPSNVIGNAIGSVYYEHFASLDRKGKPLYGVALRSTLVLLLGPGMLIILGAVLLAPSVFAFVFGEDWRQAGVYAQWMSIWIAASLANVPSVRLAPVIGAQGQLLCANVVILFFRVASILVALQVSTDPLFAVAAFSVVSAVAYFGLIAWMLLLTRAHDKRYRETENLKNVSR